MSRLERVDGGLAAAGVRTSGVRAGLRAERDRRADLALVDAGAVVPAAAVQTTNQVAAAPVHLTRAHLADHRARAVLLNAGSANACTGEQGARDARRSAEALGAQLGCAAEQVAVCSTGVIGQPLDVDRLERAVPDLVARLGDRPADAADAAEAILTTDTVAKQAAAAVDDGDGRAVVGAMGKGSGMIAPSMATMLAVAVTDAALDGATLAGALREASDATFGRISVDACQSTNDAVVALATGTARRSPSPQAVAEALHLALADLAEAICRDGEGASRLVRLHVTGARSEGEAVQVGHAVAASALVRTAVAGGDPNWGRVLAAVGAGPVAIDPDRVDVAVGDVLVCRGGALAPHPREQAAEALAGGEVDLTVDLGLGGARATVTTCDLTHEYVTINAEYTT